MSSEASNDIDGASIMRHIVKHLEDYPSHIIMVKLIDNVIHMDCTTAKDEHTEVRY